MDDDKITRLAKLSSVFNDVAITPLIVVWIVGTFAGYFPFKPLDRITTLLEQHIVVSKDREETDKNISEALKLYGQLLSRYERRDRLVECHARYQDKAVRDLCLGDLGGSK